MYAVKRRDLCYAQISLLLVYTAILGWFLLCKNIAGLTRRSAGEKPYRVFRMKNSKVINVQGCTLMTRRPCRHRQGWRADKAITSFHKNRIFVKTRKVMGNTDVAHYRGQLATTLSSFCSAKTRSSKIGTGRRSIYNICILNYCKLTFEFFKNYSF